MEAGLVRFLSGRPRAARSAQHRAAWEAQVGRTNIRCVMGTQAVLLRPSCRRRRRLLPLAFAVGGAAPCARKHRPCDPSAFLSNASIHPPHGSLQVLCFACCEPTVAVHEGEAAGR